MIKIRKGKLKDLKKIIKLLNKTPELSSGVGNKTYSNEWVSSCLKDKSRDLVLVAEDNGKLVGFLMAEIWKSKRYSFLSDVFIARRYRNKGVASELVNLYEKECKKKRINKLLMLALVKNSKIHKFLKKRHYKQGEIFYLYEGALK